MLVVRRQIKSVVHVVTASIRKSMGVFGYAEEVLSATGFYEVL